MNVQKKNVVSGRDESVIGRVSWIADELMGIRSLEERLSRKLRSNTTANSRMLLNGIRDLNLRVDLLDRALDEFSRARRAA